MAPLAVKVISSPISPILIMLIILRVHVAVGRARPFNMIKVINNPI